WAFTPPVRPDVPEAHRLQPVGFPARNPLDAFVLARLEGEGLAPSAEAGKVTLLRRLYLDLVGLPPTIEDVEEFVADDSPHAYQRQVDRLLASPHYGERWGRHWLDAARYADSDGFEKDKPRFVWSYRDWVVSAFNRDLPYDRFIIEQIAGDLLRDDTPTGSDPFAAGTPSNVSTARPQRGLTPSRDVSSTATGSDPFAGHPSSTFNAAGPQRGLTPSRDATQDQLVATGFLRNSMINEEGGVDPEQFRMEAMFDRMDAIGKGILGITIQCAQCHSHKYDPLTQREYYRMFAFLNNDHEANVAAYTPDEQMQRAELFRRIREIEADLQHRHPDWPERMAAWENSVRDKVPAWQPVMPFPEDLTTGGQKYLPQSDGSLLAQSYAPTKHDATFRVRTDARGITAFRLELLNHPNLPLGGPGRSIQGTAALSEFFVEAAPVDAPGQKTRLKIARATANVNPPETELAAIYDDKSGKRRVTGSVAFAVDGDELTAWSHDIGPHRRNRPYEAVFTLEAPIDHAAGTLLTFHLVQKHGGWNSDDNQNHNLGCFRLSITTQPDAAADPLPRGVREILSVPREERTPAQTAAVFSHWRTTVPEWKEASDQIEELWRQHPAGSSQLVLLQRDEPRGTHVLKRGDFLKPLEAVEPGVPAFLHPLPEGAPPTRLTFARWLVDPASPTTARSMVNRVWQSYFGTGLASTSEDLGSQCEAPSHPDLLDWLAVEFVGVESRESSVEGQTSAVSDQRSAVSAARSSDPQPSTLNPQLCWSLKRLHRLIVTSGTYRQSSDVTPGLLARDPYNRLLARGPRIRVEAEVVRDVALAASGLLNPKLGGPSVYPPAPDFLFQPPASYGPKVWNEDAGADRYRRALYTFRFRSVPYPMLEAFDAPNGDFSCVRRARSNTPLQALTTLNEPLFVECARALALRTLLAGGATDRERAEYAFRRCLARKPTDDEIAVLLETHQRQVERFATADADAWAVAGADSANPPMLPDGATPAQLAAWTVVARVLLNLDETITKP
ncbi:MAG: DUF1549 and DUF1553 domain-containing protein, partial [Planctomycetes bacterium]|nr:DUF1549 and DUF1553 domain-containing protein [Planctomycetota bacterium]